MQGLLSIAISMFVDNNHRFSAYFKIETLVYRGLVPNVSLYPAKFIIDLFNFIYS